MRSADPRLSRALGTRQACRRPVLVTSTAVVLLLLSSLAARADQVVLRMAAIAPEGTAWARELRAFSRDVDDATHGSIRIKWYLGGIAGDDLTALSRVRHGQLDGLAGASFCEQLAPSLRVIRVIGLYRSRTEVIEVLQYLAPQLDEEFRKSGFVNLMDGLLGADVLFSRRPVLSMADFRSTRWWMWTLSPLYRATLPKLGARMVVLPIDRLAATYQNGEVDGFIMPASAALAFQLSTLATYLSPIDTAMLPACMVLTNGAMDPLSVDQQLAIRAAAAKFRIRFNELSAELDRSLLGRLFEKQGLKLSPVSQKFRYEFFEAARDIRDQLDESLVPRNLLARVLSFLADIRAEHAPR
jgi:TRAP-type C4-dicarboxylate transport system substrate-binding protein